MGLTSSRISLTVVWLIALAIAIAYLPDCISAAVDGEDAEFRIGKGSKSGWGEFVSERGRFRIAMPGKPSFRQTIKNTKVGDIKENLYEITSRDGDFSVEFTDLPGIAVILGGKKAILRKVKGAFLESEGGKEIDYFPLKRKKLRGAELIYETGKDIGHVRMFLSRNRLYVVVAQVPRHGGDRSIIGKYLDSFKIMKVLPTKKMHKYIDMQEPSSEPEPIDPKATADQILKPIRELIPKDMRETKSTPEDREPGIPDKD